MRLQVQLVTVPPLKEVWSPQSTFIQGVEKENGRVRNLRECEKSPRGLQEICKSVMK